MTNEFSTSFSEWEDFAVYCNSLQTHRGHKDFLHEFLKNLIEGNSKQLIVPVIFRIGRRS